MKRLSYETVVALHSELIAQIGGLDGVRGQYLYPTIQAMAAHLAFSLIKNHPFLDGNKRIGILSMMVFLELNNLPIICTDDELISLGLGLADSSISEEELIEWIITHS